MATNNRRHILACSIAVALLATAALPAFAQAGRTGSPGTDEAEATRLDQIVVRAQKREELLQDVPVTMSSFNEQQLEDAGIDDIKDVQMLVPALSVISTDSEANTTARIRGVGTTGDNAGLESSVGIVIDGVPRVRNGVAFGDLGEIEQIEVLKGPQGTLFGKNTSAGVLSITTKRPSLTQDGHAELTAGNYGALGASASYSNAIGDLSAFRIFATGRERDGFSDVFVNGGPRTETTDADQDFHSFRGQFLFMPSDDLDINVIADYTKREENCCTSVGYARGPVSGLIDIFAGGPGRGAMLNPNPEDRLAFTNDSTLQHIEDQGASAELNWALPWASEATLTSITSVRKWNLQAASDLDFSAADLAIHDFSPDNGQRFNTFTQELRIGGSSGPLEWLGGVYVDNVRIQRSEAIDLKPQYESFLSTLLLSGIGAALPPGAIDLSNPQNFFSEITGLAPGATYRGRGQQDQWNQSSQSTAAFGNLTYNVSDALSLTGGLRYTHEKKETDFYYSNPNGGIGCGAAITTDGIANALLARGVPASVIPLLAPTIIGNMCLPWQNPLFNGLNTSDELSENEWSGTFKASYRWSEHVMGYLSAARGYKAGGFNLARSQSSNGTTTGGSGILPVTNTQFPGETVDSFELGTKTTWADGNLLLNAALFHSKFTDYQVNTFSGISWVVESVPELTTQGVDIDLLWQTGVTGLSLQAATTYTDSKFGDDLLINPSLALLPGNTGSFAPKWTVTSGFGYDWQFSNSLAGRFALNGRYVSDYNTAGLLGDQYIQDAFTLVDARLTVGADDDRWLVEFWGHNLTDKTYAQVKYPPALQTGSVNAFLGAPRTYGVTLRLNF